MIKINLLRKTDYKVRTWSFERSQLGLYGAVLLLITFAGLGWYYWHLLEKRADLQWLAGQLEQEDVRLQAVKVQLDRYEDQKGRLEERIAVIERLKDNQRGPVMLMNAVIASLPPQPRLWLTGITQNSSSVKIEGQAFDVPSIADFIANLNNSPPFRRVELGFWEEEDNVIRFELSCETGG